MASSSSSCSTASWHAAALGGIVGASGSLPRQCTTSMRKPSTPRSSQKRSDVVHGGLDLRVRPVQIGLLGQEECRYYCPVASSHVQAGAAAERGEPVVGRPPPGAGRATRTSPRFGLSRDERALDEPGMLVAGVVRHPVEEHPHAALVRFGEQAIEVGERAEERIDVAVVGDVVAEVGHRRRKNGESHTASTPSQHEVVELGRRPRRSPTPSPFASAKDRG